MKYDQEVEASKADEKTRELIGAQPQQTPTPRTEAAGVYWNSLPKMATSAQVVNADFARQLERENAALVVARDEAIKAHGVVWNAVRRAAHAFRWLGIEKDHPELAEDQQAILEAEKLTPKWSTSWVIMTTTEADALRIANAQLATALKELTEAEDASCDKFTALEINRIEKAMKRAEAALAAHATQKAPS
jgi:hypothetical protein